MKILIFSMGPIFKDHVQGGSQKILVQVSKHLGKSHRVTILCPKREDNKEEFKLCDNVTVKPSLEFKSYPEPYYVAPFKLANIVESVQKEIDKHDVLYIHDSELNFFFLQENKKPIVCSLRDFVYPDTLVGAFNFRRDSIIVNSRLTQESLKHTVGRYMPDIDKRVTVIPNGFDLDFLKKTKPSEILSLLPRPLDSKDVIIYPNRPDERKGIFLALEIVSRLKHKRGFPNVRLLIPEHIDMNVKDGKNSSYGDEHYRKVREVAERLDILDNLIFHAWVPQRLMPEYYSLAKLTLSIGSFIEAFGSNSSVESICCGTPAIVSRVGAQRYTFPDDVVPKVDYGDLDRIEDLSAQILAEGYDLSEAQRYVREHYDYEKMLRAYESVITSAKVLSPITPNFLGLDLERPNLTFKLPPWCTIGNKGLYNDYLYGFQNVDEKLLRLLGSGSGFSTAEADNTGLTHDYLEAEIRKGNLVYEYSTNSHDR